MKDKNTFYSLHCVAGIDGKSLTPFREVYLLGPQFCGGDKHVIARVYHEAEADAKVEDPELASLPPAVLEFLRWSAENVVAPARGRA